LHLDLTQGCPTKGRATLGCAAQPLAGLKYGRTIDFAESSDYVDALECNMTPEADSQYWVAPFIQDVFDGIIAKCRPDVAAIVKAHTSMHLA